MLNEFTNDTRVVHVREPYDIYIGRGHGSEWGNPFTHIKDRYTRAEFVVKTREEAIAKYREWIIQQPHLLEKIETLRNKKLGCWCKPLPCHGDVLLELINLQIELGITQISILKKIYKEKYIDHSINKSKNLGSESSSRIF
jgi:hypothetical protein